MMMMPEKKVKGVILVITLHPEGDMNVHKFSWQSIKRQKKRWYISVVDQLSVISATVMLAQLKKSKFKIFIFKKNLIKCRGQIKYKLPKKQQLGLLEECGITDGLCVCSSLCSCNFFQPSTTSHCMMGSFQHPEKLEKKSK